MTTQKLVDLWEQMIRRGFELDSFSIALYCGRIARMDPERGAKLYFEKLVEQREAASKVGTNFSWHNSVGQHFHHVLPTAYENSRLQTLGICRSFLEQFFSSRSGHPGESSLVDHPHMLLYGEYQRHDEQALFEWFRLRFLDYCRADPIAPSQLLGDLQASRWKTLRQLAFLAMLENPTQFGDEIFCKAMEIISGIGGAEGRYLLLRTLEKGFAALDDGQRQRVTTGILTCRANRGSDDEYRWVYAPLNHIPENLRSAGVKERLDGLKAHFGDYKYLAPFRMSEAHAVSSPVPKMKLAQMSPDELYEFLIKNRDLKEKWSSDTLTPIGGVEELAREVSDLFVEQTQQYEGILTKLSYDPLNYVYLDSSLSKLNVDESNADWFIDIVLNIYKVEEVQLSLSRAMSKTVPVFTRQQWDKLKPVAVYLAESARDPASDTFRETQQQGYANTAVSDGINTTRGEICEVLLRAYSRFGDTDLQAALERLAGDPTISVRAAFLFYLPLALAACGWEQCFGLFQKAFDPTEPEFMEAAAQFLRYVPGDEFEQMRPVLSRMHQTKKGPVAETAAALTALYVVRGLLPEDELNQVLFDPEYEQDAKTKALDVVTGSLVSERHFAKCLEILCNVLKQGSDELINPMYRVFVNAQPANLAYLQEFIGILIIRAPWGELVYWMLEYLEKAAAIWPREAFEILEKILRSAEEIDYSRGYIPPTHSKAPLIVVNLVLEICPDLEERALNVLDRLITIRWTGVDEYLRSAERL